MNHRNLFSRTSEVSRRMQFLSTRAVIVNGGDTCPEPPQNNLKRVKKILKARKGKKKRENTKRPERVFFYCKHGENHSLSCRTNPQNQRENSGLAEEKRIIRFAWGTIRGDAGSQYANAPNRVPKLHLRQKI